MPADTIDFSTPDASRYSLVLGLGVRSYRNNDTGPKMWALCETAEEPLLAGV
jgi:hypothetical protein